MDFSIALRSPYTWGSLGTAGVGGAGIVGWNMLGSNSDSIPSIPSLGDVKLDSNAQSLSFHSYGCVGSFFPGVNISHKDSYGSSEAYNPDFEIVNQNGDGLKIKPSSDSEVSTGGVFGCALMKMSQDLSVPKWHLTAEITVKSDKIGWALWFFGYGKPDDGEEGTYENVSTYQQDAKYRLIFLEKDDSDNWKIRAGYSWDDQSIDVSKQLKIHVSAPVSSGGAWINENKNPAAATTGASKTDNSYLGFWESNNPSSGKGIFEEIEIWGGDKNNAEVLGGSGDFKGTSSPQKGYKGVVEGYNLEKGNWSTFKQTSNGARQTIDISDVLTDWYKPFENKKGTWKDKSDYCSASNTERKMSNVCGG